MKVLALIDGVYTEVEIQAGGGAAAVPTVVADGAVFSVPAGSQVLFTEEIELDGELDLDGVLVEVN